MGTITITNEKRTGSFVYESGEYKITGNSKLDLEKSTFDSADGNISKNNTHICYFNAYTEALSEKAKININGIDAELLIEVTNVVKDCLAAIAEHYA